MKQLKQGQVWRFGNSHLRIVAETPHADDTFVLCAAVPFDETYEFSYTRGYSKSDFANATFVTDSWKSWLGIHVANTELRNVAVEQVQKSLDQASRSADCYDASFLDSLEQRAAATLGIPVLSPTGRFINPVPPRPQRKARRMRPNGLPLPARAHLHDMGLDLRLDLAAVERHAIGGKEEWRNTSYVLGPGSIDTVSTWDGVMLAPDNSIWIRSGFAVEIRPGEGGLVRGRSGNSMKGLIVIEGNVDAGYSDEIAVGLHNISGEPITLKHGDKIAQLVICKINETDEVVEGEVAAGARGAKGFGSTDGK